MTDDNDGVDPDDPRPPGHYGRFRDAPWYYVTVGRNASRVHSDHTDTDTDTPSRASSTYQPHRTDPPL
jgi:hypothetical protein